MTKSIRIKNSKGDKATIWPVGEFHYSVKWEDNESVFLVLKGYVDDLFSDGSLKEIENENNLLQTIKQFVEEFDAQVVTCKEGYLVHSDNYTIDPYRANSDEELKEILQSIRVLKKYEGV
jgi:hypothetical protein